MESIFCVEQVNVPPELGTIMKQYTKAVLRDRPGDLYKYSANFFAALCGQTAPFDKDGQYVESLEYKKIENSSGSMLNRVEALESTSPVKAEERDVIQRILNEYDVNGDGRLPKERIASLLELQKKLGVDEAEIIGVEELLDTLETDENGTVDLMEFRQLFCQSNGMP